MLRIYAISIMQMGMVTHDSTVDIITSFAASPVSLLAIDTNIIVLFAIGIAESATRFSLMGSISIKVDIRSITSKPSTG